MSVCGERAQGFVEGFNVWVCGSVGQWGGIPSGGELRVCGVLR